LFHNAVIKLNRKNKFRKIEKINYKTALKLYFKIYIVDLNLLGNYFTKLQRVIKLHMLQRNQFAFEISVRLRYRAVVKGVATPSCDLINVYIIHIWYTLEFSYDSGK